MKDKKSKNMVGDGQCMIKGKQHNFRKNKPLNEKESLVYGGIVEVELDLFGACYEKQTLVLYLLHSSSILLKSGKVSRNTHKIVVAERVVLNFVQRMSGIATLTKILFFINGRCCYPARILETKKTATGLRLPAGGIVNAIKSVDAHLKQKNLEMDVKVETRTLEEVKEVLEYVSGSKTRLTRIMLDNMVASGNVTIETVHNGALTHSVNALDISLKIDTELALEAGRRTKRA
ncbi:hypothetical protein BRARA_F03490 [Brassica rapa]|uniref:Uncharacterized protein n=1 Tax=Brassica campestris TaxID=3711 RepID=A0A397ZAW7_BRACM|nr:hypothetical protein BRARA_F03490 [Brassica rapa]